VKKEQIRNLLLRWRDQITPAASGMVTEMFKSVDRVLLEYADKAESNKVQVQFFEGQREIWLKQDQVTSQFHDTLHHELFNFTRMQKQRDAPGDSALSLVSKDDFERSLALQTISNQAVKSSHELYFALAQRLGVIAGGRPIPLKNLPAGPHQLAGVFERAASQLNVERPVLLALFTLFEREVMRKSTSWHEDLNEQLKQEGILPNLKYQARKNPHKSPPAGSTESTAEDGPNLDDMGHAQPTGAAPAAHPSTGAVQPQNPGTAGMPLGNLPQGEPNQPQGTGPGGEVELGDQILGRIRELLSTHRALEAAAKGVPPRPQPAHPAPTQAVLDVIDSPLVQEAGALPETGVREPDVRRVSVTQGLLDRVRSALSLQRSQVKEKVGRDRLSVLDEDAIDIVGMLFEVMLNDKRLSNTVKALLSHLHTPYLKLAVRDRAFLDHREHPARRLFDEMVEAGSRWVDEKDLGTGIYRKLQWSVERIVRAKEHPVQLFQELEDVLAKEAKKLAERQTAREARTVESEKGQARLEEARITATEACHKLHEIEQAPGVFHMFVSGPWTDYLTLLYLRSNGNIDTGSWRGALVLAERLRSFVTELLSGRPPSKPDLKRLKDEIGRRLGELIPQYQVEVDRLFELFSGTLQPAEGQAAAAPASKKAQTAQPEPTVELSPNGELLTAQLPELPPGTWVVFHDKGESDVDVVVKLSWYNSKTERFLFVDQTGAKALAMPLRELADAIDHERAHVLHASGTSYVESSLKRAMEALEKRA
jgi:hypothetical protein